MVDIWGVSMVSTDRIDKVRFIFVSVKIGMVMVEVMIVGNDSLTDLLVTSITKASIEHCIVFNFLSEKVQVSLTM